MEGELRRSSRTRGQFDRYTPLEIRSTGTGRGRGRGIGRGRGKNISRRKNDVNIVLTDKPTRHTFSQHIPEKYWIEDMRYNINSIINSGKSDIEKHTLLLNYRDSLQTGNFFAIKNRLEEFYRILRENHWWNNMHYGIAENYKYNQQLANLTQLLSEVRIGGKSNNKTKKKAKRVKSGKKR